MRKVHSRRRGITRRKSKPSKQKEATANLYERPKTLDLGHGVEIDLGIDTPGVSIDDHFDFGGSRETAQDVMIDSLKESFDTDAFLGRWQAKTAIISERLQEILSAGYAATSALASLEEVFHDHIDPKAELLDENLEKNINQLLLMLTMEAILRLVDDLPETFVQATMERLIAQGSLLPKAEDLGKNKLGELIKMAPRGNEQSSESKIETLARLLRPSPKTPAASSPFSPRNYRKGSNIET